MPPRHRRQGYSRPLTSRPLSFLSVLSGGGWYSALILTLPRRHWLRESTVSRVGDGFSS